jgi:hypothetical protein
VSIDAADVPFKWTVRTDPDPLEVADDKAKQQQQIRLIPPAGNRLLPVLIRGEEQGGKTVPLSGAEVTLEALGEAQWRQTFQSAADGWVYALVPHTAAGMPIKAVKLRFRKKKVGARLFEPVYDEVTIGIPKRDDPLIDKPAFDYQPTEPQREEFRGISVKPQIRKPTGATVPLVGAKVTVKLQGTSSRATEHVWTLEDKEEKEVRFPNLEPGIYVVTVTPPQTFEGWPIKAGPKKIGPHYLGTDEHFVADVEPFGFDQINLLIETPDNRPLDHAVSFVIYGPDGSAEVTAKAGKFSAAAPSKGPLKIKLARGTAPAVGGVPLEMQTPDQDVQSPPSVTPVALQYEHAIMGRAVDESASPMPGAVVVLYDDDGREAARAVADDGGNFTAGLEKAGSYSIAIQTEGGRPISQQLVSVQSAKHVGDVVYRRWVPPSRKNGSPQDHDREDEPGFGKATREAVTDLAAYPVLTEEVSTTGPPAPVAGGFGGGTAGAGYGQAVDQVIRDVLGWRPGGDVAGFQAALSGAFQLREVEGHTEWAWQQRGYAVQADMGALTGAQASIYARAKNALDQLLPLLAGLTSLNPALFPEQDREAIRTVVTAELQELVGELALEGGPRIQRVDELFGLLLGESIGSANLNPDVVQGQLGTLRQRFALTADWIEKVDDERVVTNFRVIVEQILALQASWSSDRALLSVVDSRTSLGTILIWLSRALEAVCESVSDLSFALDSVYIDAAQRQVIELSFGPHQPPLLLSDLLDWIVRASRDEGPRLIQDAGKDGVRAFAPVLRRLRGLVGQTVQAITDPDLPPGLRTPRVRRAFAVLHDQLREATRLAGLVQLNQPPEITSVTVEMPDKRRPNVFRLDLTGANFRSPASAVLEVLSREDIPDVIARHVHVVSPTSARATFRIPQQGPNASRVNWQLVFVNGDGTQSDPFAVQIQR